MSEWQSIETAPKDGTIILLFKPKISNHNKEIVAICKWGEKPRVGHAWVHHGAPSIWKESEPTHWMHLPKPPKE